MGKLFCCLISLSLGKTCNRNNFQRFRRFTDWILLQCSEPLSVDKRELWHILSMCGLTKWLTKMADLQIVSTTYSLAIHEHPLENIEKVFQSLLFQGLLVRQSVFEKKKWSWTKFIELLLKSSAAYALLWKIKERSQCIAHFLHWCFQSLPSKRKVRQLNINVFLLFH